MGTVYDGEPNHPPDDASRPPGRRQRKKQHTRDELMACAAHLFAERGFDAVTTADIADAADVSQRTFFRHFPSKEAVVYGRAHELRDAIVTTFRSRPCDESTVDSVVAAMTAIARHYDTDHDEAFLQARLAATYPSVASYARATVQSDWEHELTAAIAQRTGTDPSIDPEPEILAGAAFSAYRAAIRRWSAGAGDDRFGDLLADSLAVFARLRR